MVDADRPEEWLVVLTVLPAEATDGDNALVQGVGEAHFTLLEVAAPPDTDLAPGDRVAVAKSDRLGPETRQLTYGTLTESAQAALRATIGAIIQRREERFIDWYNNVEPLSRRRHQLELLPGIGTALREAILTERQHRPFTDFTDLEERVEQLRTPHELLVERVLTELKEETDYQLFVP
jgi:putative nucleotide binding protein